MQLWSPAGSLNWAYPHPRGNGITSLVGNDRELILYADGQLTGGIQRSQWGPLYESNFPFRVGGNGIFDATGNHFGIIDEVFEADTK